MSAATAVHIQVHGIGTGVDGVEFGIACGMGTPNNGIGFVVGGIGVAGQFFLVNAWQAIKEIMQNHGLAQLFTIRHLDVVEKD